MAYGVVLAAVEERDIEAYRASSGNDVLPASAAFGCSHGIASWAGVQPLGQLLGQAIDEGERLREDLWHPLRVPVVVRPAEVVVRLAALEAAFASYLADAALTATSDDWAVHETSQVLNAYRAAASSSHAVVSAIEPPVDAERARKVSTPIRLARKDRRS